MKRRQWVPILLILSAIFVWSGCKSNALSDAEQTAVRFYKAVWVQGDLERAASMLQDKKKVKELKWRVEETQKLRPSNSAIFITESPQDPHILSRVKTYLIYREADKKDYKVEVKNYGGKWKVVSFKQSYSLKSGGYNSFETYERLSYEHPHTDWKKIENP
jgi:hypothetical protein